MTDIRWLDAEEALAWRSLVMANARLMATLDHELMAQDRISLPDYEVLMHLSETPEQRLRMTELAERVHLSPSGLTRRVDRLVRSRLVSREQCHDDRRGSFAVLSPQGAAVLAKAAPTHLVGVRTHLIDLLDRDEITALSKIMTRVMDACKVPTSMNNAAR